MDTIEKTHLLNLVKQPKLLVSLLEQFIDGEIPINLFTNKPHLVNLFTKFQTVKRLPSLKNVLSTPELVQLNNEMTCNDKKRLCNNNFHLMKLLLTSVQVSTLNDKDLENFYNWLCQEMLKKLSYQAKIDYVDLDLNLSNGCVTKTIQNSWFSNQIQSTNVNNSLPTSFPLSKFTLVNGMDVEDIVLRAKKIKLRLTSHQKQLLQQWNNHVRYTYNSTIWRLDTDIEKQSKYNLRNQIVPAEVNNTKRWILETPKEIRARAVFEAFTRWKTGITQVKNKTIKFFQLRFKDKKYQMYNGWSIDIEKSAIKKIDNKSIHIYKRVTNKEIFKLGENLDMEIEHDCKIHFDGDSYYLVVPYHKQKAQREIDSGIISLDPGVRTFLTGVDSNKTIEIGVGSGTTMFRKLKYLDSLISKRSKTRDKRTKKKFKTQIIKAKKQIKNLQDDLHKKSSKWLCNNYSNVVMPQFGSKDMVKKADRKLGTKTVRSMSMLAHGRFLTTLKNKAEECGTKITIVDEKYTSKTCSACGHVKTKRFTSKEYRCERCLLKIDRDRNGAINIMKKLFLPNGKDRVDRTNEIDVQEVHTNCTASSRRVARAIVSVCQ